METAQQELAKRKQLQDLSALIAGAHSLDELIVGGPVEKIVLGPGPRMPRGGFGGVRYQLRTQRIFHVEVDAALGLWFTSETMETPSDPLGPAVPLEKLPADPVVWCPRATLESMISLTPPA